MPIRPLSLSYGVKDVATQTALRQIEQLLSQLTANTTVALFTATTSGTVPASGGNPTDVLHADGTWGPAGGVALPINESDVIGLVSDLAGKVPATRNVNTVAPLTGGGSLAGDLTLDVSTFTAGTRGVVPLSGGGTTNYLRADGTWSAPSAPAANFGWFADGSDGALHFDGTSTVTLLGGTNIVPSGGVYTLPRNIHATDITIDVGVEVKCAGYIVYANGTGTINGTLSRDGNDCPGGNTGANAVDDAGFLPGSSLGGANGGLGGAGSASSGTSNCGVGATLGSVIGTTGVGANGGTCQGGAGGGTGLSAGGGSGGVSLLAPQYGDIHDPWIGWLRVQDTSSIALATNRWVSGTGGGGGAAESGGQGGGGGSSGGALVAYLHTVAGVGMIRAKGGNGGNGNPQGQTIAAGGGGGGSGGLLWLFYVDGIPPGVSVAGGSGGAGSHGGFDGGSGGPGLKFIIKLG